LLVACAFVVLTGARARAEPQGDEPLRLAVSSNVRGSFASLACRREPPPPYVHGLDPLFHEAIDAGDLIVDAGHFLGASFLASEALRQNPALLADLVTHFGIRAMALEHRDLVVDRPLLIAFAKALAPSGVPLVLTNLACDPEAKELCDVILDARATGVTFDTPAGIVAFLAIMDPSIFAEIPDSARAGLRLEDPVQALAKAVREARAAGAKHVVVAYEPNPAANLESTFTFLQAIDDDDAPDLVLVDRLAEHIASLERPHSSLRVVATRPGGLVRVEGERVRIPAPREEDADRFARTWSKDFDLRLCQTLGAPLEGGVLPSPFGRREFREFAADVLRRDLGADIAIVSRETYGSGVAWPLEDQLTLLDVHAALPFDDEVGTVTLDGATVRRLFEGVTSVGFVTRGFDRAKGTVNGRALVDTQRYRIATTRLYFDHAAAKTPAFREGARGFDRRSLRDLVLDELGTPSSDDPRSRMGKPEESASWAFRGTLRSAFSTTQVTNGDRAKLTDGPLVRSDALALTVDLEARIDADHPRWQFLNGPRLRYGFAGVGGPLTKNRDVIDNRSVFILKQSGGAVTPVGVPNLFAEVFVETETAPPPTRAYHHLLLRPVAGLRFELSSTTALQVGVGADWEALATREQLAASGSLPLMPAAVATITARPTPLFTIGPRTATGEASIDLARRNPFDMDETEPKGVELRGRAKLTVPISSFLALTTTYDLYARRAWAPDRTLAGGTLVTGVAHDVVVGLDVTFSALKSSYAR
jgi:hypothetical protein